MTMQETLKVLAILKAAYPNSYKDMNQQEAAGTVTVWAVQFANIPVDIVLMALHKLIATSKFPPSVSEVKNKLGDLRWEAYEVINRQRNGQMLPDDTLKQYERIYNITQDYGKTKVEPSLHDMIGRADKLMLN